MDVLSQLLDRNARFAAADHREVPFLPRLGTLVVTCPDARVDPAHIFGLQPGDAAVIRAAGGRISPIVLQNLLFLRAAGAGGGQSDEGLELILMPHTDCGFAYLLGPEHRAMLATFLGVGTEDLDAMAITDPFAGVRFDVEALAANPLIPSWLAVTGVVYDVRTGRVEVVVRRAPLRTPSSTVDSH